MNKALSIPQLPQAWSNVLIAGAVVYVAYLLSKGLGRMDEAAAAITEPIGNIWSDIAATLNGNERVQTNEARFYLNSKWVGQDGSISAIFRDSIEAAHPGNAALFAAITSGGRLRDEYAYLLDGEVSALTIKNKPGQTIVTGSVY